MSDEAIIKRQVLDKQTIDEIEKNSVAKCYEKVLHDLQNNATNFHEFKTLKKIEANVYYLAKDYLDNFKKKLVPFNEEIHETAERFFTDSSTYETIKDLGNPNSLNNKRYLKMLIEIVKDCIDSAFQLASHREKTRQNSHLENIKETLARIERDNNRRWRKLDSLIAKQSTNDLRIPKAEQLDESDSAPSNSDVTLQQETTEHPTVTPETRTNSQNDALNVHSSPPPIPRSNKNTRKRTRTTLPSEAEAVAAKQLRMNESPNPDKSTNLPLGLFQHVSEEKCKKLRSKHPFADRFVREYLPKLFSSAELILPLKDLPLMKQIEYFKVCSSFYGNLNWDELFVESMNKLRNKKRGEIFKVIGKSVGYGISSNGKEFYYKLSNGMCFQSSKCLLSTALETRLCGDINVPKICGNFDYVVFIEKESHHSTIQKLLANGNIEKL